MCGGPDLTDAQRTELSAAKAAAKRRADAEVREEEQAKADAAAERRAARHRRPTDDDDLDGEQVKEHTRYAVTLLRQDHDAWGAGSAGSGVLG